MSLPGRPKGEYQRAQPEGTPASTPALSLQDIACTFVSKDDPGQRYTAVRDVTLTVGAGEFVSVVGPTGCGKSTLLNVGAGLLVPSTGTVQVFGEPQSGINSRAGYLFQSESLMPWRSVLDNVLFTMEILKRNDRAARELTRRVHALGLARERVVAQEGARAPVAGAFVVQTEVERRQHQRKQQRAERAAQKRDDVEREEAGAA